LIATQSGQLLVILNRKYGIFISFTFNYTWSKWDTLSCWVLSLAINQRLKGRICDCIQYCNMDKSIVFVVTPLWRL